MSQRRRNRPPSSFRSAARRSRIGPLPRAWQIESLEQRRLLAVIVWDGEGGDNNWNTPANWSGNILPGSNDDAQIGLAFGGATITRDSGIGGIRSLTSEAALNFTGGSLFISENSTINNAWNLSGPASVSLESMTLAGTGTLVNGALLRATGATNINTAITTTAGSTILVVSNSNVSNSTLTMASGFTNNGTIELRSSETTLSALAVTDGTLVNSSTGAINATGDSSVARELRAQLDNQGVVNVAASMTIDMDSADHVNRGTINIRDATLLVTQTGTTPTFTNIVVIDIALAAALVINGGAVSQANPGTISGGGTFTLSGASFSGVGMIGANVISNTSVLSPGFAPGAGLLAIDGNYTQDSTSTLLIEIGGLAPATQFDQVIVSGTTSLAGTLRVDLMGGFAPNAGDSFLVLDGDTTGNFTTLDLDPLPSGRDWQVEVDPVTLTVVSVGTDISVTKTDSPDPVPAGTNLTYTITVSNNSSVEAIEVTFTDVVPTGTTFVSLVAPDGWNTDLPEVGSGGTVRATRGLLRAGSVETFTLVVQVGADLTAGTIITNTAQVSAQTSDSNPENNTTSILTTVSNALNRPPVLDAIADQNGSEGTAITFTATASDPDSKAILTFSLDDGAPAGAAINASTGAFAWTPSEAQGPGTFDITVRVTDDGSPALSDSQTINITVGEVNLPPVLAPIADRDTQVGQTVTFTATASDPDIPAGELSFSLDDGAPAGAVIDPATGEFSFTPIADQADQIFSITVRVTDDGDPELSDIETFEITVEPQPEFAVSPVSGPPVAVPGQLRSFSITFTDPNSAGGYTATINWGDGITDNGVIRTQTADGVTRGGVSFWHTYTTVGNRTIRLTLRDSLGNERTSDFFITVQLVTIQPDYLDPLRRSLVVGGFENFDDQITFNPDNGGVNVMYHNYSHGRFAINGSVVAFSQGGNDTVRVHRTLANPSMLFGQAGNDFLVGGAGGNVLVGGAGNDTLFGNAARDVLFGGLGMDRMFGIAPDEFSRVDDGDLIASDLTAWEYDPALMASIFRRWNSSASYADRLQNLRYLESPTLNSNTVFEDFASDKLIGGTGQDWFVFFSTDWVMDREENEEGLGVRL